MDASTASPLWACQQQVLRFFHLLDAKQYEQASLLFDAEGAWVRPGSTVEGQDAILRALMQRPPERVTRHVVTNFLVLEGDTRVLRITCLLTTYAVEGAHGGKPPTLFDSAVGLFSAHAWLRLDAECPVLTRLELAPVWTFARPVAGTP